MNKFLLSTLLGACLVNAYSSELVIKDIYLSTELLPSDFDYDNSSDLQSVSGSDEFDSSFGASLGAMYSWSLPGSSNGWLAGGEVTMRQQSISSDSSTSSFGIRGLVGYAYAYSDRYTFTAEPFIGFGITNMTIDDTVNIDGFDMDGTYLEYGVRLKSIITINHQWQGFVSLGYFVSDTSLDGGPDSFESELESAGLYASFGLSWRWNTAPWTLE